MRSNDLTFLLKGKRQGGCKFIHETQGLFVLDGVWIPLPLEVMFFANTVFNTPSRVDKAPRPSISNVIWVLSSDTICQLNQLFSNSEVAMLSMTEVLTVGNAESVIESSLSRKISLNFTMYNALVHAS